jgi:hypothetical protein
VIYTNIRATWYGPIIEVARRLRGARRSGVVRVWNSECSSKAALVRRSNRPGFWKTASMKIIWRNSNTIARNPVSLVRTGRSDESGQLRRFYRSRAGLGILGTNFELWVNRKKSSSAA